MQLETFHQKLRELKVSLILILSQLFHLRDINLHLNLVKRYEFVLTEYLGSDNDVKVININWQLSVNSLVAQLVKNLPAMQQTLV